MTQEQLSKLRKNLPSRYILILTKRTNFSQSTIYKVLHGERENHEVMTAAINLASEHQTKLENQKKEIEQL